MKLKLLSRPLLVLSIIKGIFVMALILSLALWSIPILSFNSGIWLILQEKLGVLDGQDAKTYNELIIEFFRSGSKLEFLNEREFKHMEDVKQVITIANILFVFSFVYLVSGFSYFSKSEKRFLLESIRKTSLFVFIATLASTILIFANFNLAFLSFHKLFFVINFIFPADSLLKILYPDKFFQGLSMIHLLSVSIVSLAVFLISRKLKLK